MGGVRFSNYQACEGSFQYPEAPLSSDDIGSHDGVSSLKYVPLGPVMEIRLSLSGESRSIGPFTALVDPGADGTQAPFSSLDDLYALIIDVVRVRSHRGEWRHVQMFTVDLEIESVCLPAIEVVGADGDEIVLGRNVINLLVLLLDGIGEVLEVKSA